jgi:hypothetical protein
MYTPSFITPANITHHSLHHQTYTTHQYMYEIRATITYNEPMEYIEHYL